MTDQTCIPPLPVYKEAACPDCGGPELDGYVMHDRDCVLRARLRAAEKARSTWRYRLKRWVRDRLRSLNARWPLAWVREQWDWTSFWVLVILVPIAVLVTYLLINVAEQRP